MADHDFSVKLNLEDTGRGAYRDLIQDLRKKLTISGYSHNLPILRPQVDGPIPWFDVVLQTGQARVTFRLRRDNVYLVGYQVHRSSGDDQWREFTEPGNPHLINPNSILLRFGGGYTQLARVGNRSLAQTLVGRQDLIRAVDRLANTTTTTTDEERAQSLTVVIFMISEAIRFRQVSDFVTTNYLQSSRVDSDHEHNLAGLVNGWANLSSRLLRADTGFDFNLPRPNNTSIETEMQAKDALGMLKYFNFRSGFPRVPRAVQFGMGQPLAEVFSVRIDDIDGESPGDLYGTITVTDGLISQYLYNRKSSDYESIYPGEICTLTGPYRCISAYDSFTVNLDLWDYDTLSPDDEVSRGQITWNVFESTNSYNVFLSQKVDGKNGSSMVNYAVFSNAVQATIEVTLIDGDGEDPADVYGLLAAQDNLLRQEIRLFRISEPKKYINVSPGEQIPLSRSAVVVSLESSLTVRAELYDYDTASPDDEIAKGSASFMPQLSGSSTQNITGKYGKIEVKITWINT